MPIKNTRASLHVTDTDKAAGVCLMCEYLCPTATTDAPMPGPVGIQFVNETPKIDRGSVLVNFMTMGSIPIV